MSKISIANVIRVTLVTASKGLENVNTSALGIITDEVPIPNDFGTFRTYKDPQGVAEDFGSNSETYALALSIFGQSPNIITGGGYLVIIPREQAAAAAAATLQSSDFVNLSGLTAVDYNINAAVDGGVAGDLLIGPVDTTSIATATTSLNSTAVTAAGLIFSISGEISSARVTLKTIATGSSADIAIGAAGTGTDIAPLLRISGSATGADTGLERVKDAIIRTQGSVNYFGIVLNEKQADTDLTEIAALVQTQDKIIIVASNLEADIAGVFKTLKDSGYTHTRCLYYSITETDALNFAAGYASRGLSTNFDGVNTASTINLKDIVGFVGDTGLNQILYDSALANGVDAYPDYGVPKVISSGANNYFDQVYNRLALKTKLQIAGFNYLAQTSTKIPQTEPGMTGLKGAYRTVCQLFITNGVGGLGLSWNSATTFGPNPEDHRRNITDVGYFIYSAPIIDQSQTQRDARIAPLVQIALKESGAIHSTDVVIQIEA